MAQFTMALKTVLELTGGTVSYDDNGLTRVNGGRIGLDTYPVYAEGYRDILNGLIFDRYANQEICSESPDLFHSWMRRRMRLVMPAFNELYLTKLIDYDPMITMMIKTVGTGKTTQIASGVEESTTTSESDSKSRAVNSDTPQTMLADDGDYATSASDSNSQAEAESTAQNQSDSNSVTDDERDSQTSGYQGIPADLIIAARSAIINVDEMVVDSLADLFMGIVMTGDSYFGNGRYNR